MSRGPAAQTPALQVLVTLAGQVDGGVTEASTLVEQVPPLAVAGQPPLAAQPAVQLE